MKRKIKPERIGKHHHIILALDIDRKLWNLQFVEGRSFSDLIREAVVMLIDERNLRRGNNGKEESSSNGNNGSSRKLPSRDSFA
jgi:hypothetical protein